MSIFVYLAISIFCILISIITYKEGTQSSISQLAKNQHKLLSVALCSQLLLIYPLIELTMPGLQWLPFLACGFIIITGLTNIFRKEDQLVHMITAIVSFILFVIWVLIMSPKCIIPLIICLASGKENIKWRLEVGLIISVYMTIILLI